MSEEEQKTDSKHEGQKKGAIHEEEQRAQPQKKGRFRTVFRWLFVAVGLVSAAIGGSLLWLKSDSGEAWLLSKVEAALNDAIVGGSASLDGLRNGALGEVWIDSLVLKHQEEAVVVLEGIHVRVRLWPLIRGTVSVSHSDIERAEGRLWREESGQLNLQALFDKPSEPGGGGQTYGLDQLRILSLSLNHSEQGRSYSLEEGAFSGSIQGGAEAFFLLDAELGGRFQGELFSARMDRLELAEESLLKGLRLQSMGSVLELSGRGDEHRSSLMLDGTSIDPVLVKTLLGVELQDSVELRGLVSAQGEAVSVDLQMEVLGGEFRFSGSKEQALYQGRGQFKAMDLTRVASDWGDPTPLSGSIEWFPSPLEAPSFGLALERFEVYGQRFSGVETKAEWRDSSMEIEGFLANLAEGRIWFDGVLQAQALNGDLKLQVPHLKGLEKWGIEGLRGELDLVGEVTASWEERIDAAFRGNFEGEGLDLLNQLRLQSVEGPVSVHLSDGGFSAEGGFKGVTPKSSYTREGAVFGGWQVRQNPQDGLSWEADVEAQDLVVDDGEVGGVSASFYGDSSGIRGRGDLEEVAYQHFFWPKGSLELTQEAGFLARLELEDLAQKSWCAQVNWLPEQSRVLIEELRLEPVGGAWTLAQPGYVDLGEAVELSTLEFVLPSDGSLVLDGTLDLMRLDVGLQLEGLALKSLDTFLGESGHSGQAEASLRIRKLDGPLSVDGHISARKIRVPGRVNGARAGFVFDAKEHGQEVKFSLGRGQKDLLEATAVVPMLSGWKSWGVDWNGALEGEVLVMASDNRVWASVLPPLMSLPAGWTALGVEISGSMLRPTLHMDAGMDWLLAGGPEFIRGDVQLRHEGGRVSTRGELRQAGRPVAHWVGNADSGLEDLVSWWASGGERPPLNSLDFWWSGGQVRVLSKGMDIGAIRPLMPFSIPLEGQLSGSLLVEGSPSSPLVNAGLTLSEGRLGEVSVPEAMLSLNPDSDGYDLFSYSQLAGEELRIDGRINMGTQAHSSLQEKLDEGALELQLTGGLPLGLLGAFHSGVEDARGVLLVDGKVGGSLTKPRPELVVRLEKGRFEWVPNALLLSNLDLNGRVNQEGLSIPQFSFRTHPKRSNVVGIREAKSRFQGSADLPFSREQSASVELNAVDAWVSALPDRLLRGDIVVSAEGPLNAMELLGRVSVHEARYVLTPEEWLAEDALVLNRDIVLHRRVETVAPVEQKESAIAGWRWAVDVDLGQNSWIDAEVPLSDAYGVVASRISTVGLNGRLDGIVNLENRGSGTVLQGEVGIDKGRAKVFESDFEIEEGKLVFSGASLSSPELDIRALDSSREYGAIWVDITGRPAQMRLAFSSEEGWSDTDMAAILLFNRPASSMTQSEGGAGLNLIGAAIGVMAGQASELLQMSRLVDRVEVESSEDAISAIRLGWSIGDDLFLTFSQDYSAEVDENLSEVTLEWLLSRRVQAELSTGDAGESSADLYMRWRF